MLESSGYLMVLRSYNSEKKPVCRVTKLKTAPKIKDTVCLVTKSSTPGYIGLE